MTIDVTNYLKNQLMSLGEKRPDRGTLRERITGALNDLPRQLRPGAGTPPVAGESQSSAES